MPSREELKVLQNLPLDLKIEKSILRIKEFYRARDGDVYISFSGGKDSTVLLDLVKGIYPDVPAVFIDTGLEYPELREFAIKKSDKVIKPKMNFRKVIEKYGYPIISKEVAQTIDDARKAGKSSKAYEKLQGTKKDANGELSLFQFSKYKGLFDAPFKISGKCCNEMKKKPSLAYWHKTNRKPYVGTLASESKLRETTWLVHGCNIYEGTKAKSMPLSFWTDKDIFDYIESRHLEYAPIYGDIIKNDDGTYRTTGVERTGCVFCMFGCHLEKEPNRFQKMKITHPQLYEYCMRSWDKGGLGEGEILDYLKIPH